MAISISPLYSGNNIRGAVAVLRDMTDQHKLDKLRSDFIANVSHELTDTDFDAARIQ